MANLLPLIAFFSAMLLAATVHSQDTIAFSVDTFTPNPPALIYQGDANIPADSSFLRLTGTRVSGARTVPRPWSVGRVMFTTPVQFSERKPPRQASFETTFRFRMTPARNGAAEGITFFIAPMFSTIPIGASGANLGIFPSSGRSNFLFAVEFDAYVNPAWDPSFPHIGIDIGSRKSRNTTRFENALGRVVTARISYDAITKKISVVANTVTQSYALSYTYDLKTVLMERVWVGISGSTGKNVDAIGIHDLLSWSFSSNLTSIN